MKDFVEGTWKSMHIYQNVEIPGLTNCSCNLRSFVLCLDNTGVARIIKGVFKHAKEVGIEERG